MAKILVVDDYQEIRHLYSEILQQQGYEVDTVENAEEAVTKILQGGYSLIYLDLLMPNKDGLWVLQQIAGKPTQQQNGKIIIMSFIDDESTRQMIDKALSSGAQGFLDKKISPEKELIQKTEEFLRG